MKLGHVIFGILLAFFGFMSLSSIVPIIIGIFAVFSGIVFFIYGLFGPSHGPMKVHSRSIDKIEEAVDSIWPIFIKALTAFLSILMFGGSAVFFYSMFSYPWGALAFFPLLGVVVMFILGCLLLYMAIKL